MFVLMFKVFIGYFRNGGLGSKFFNIEGGNEKGGNHRGQIFLRLLTAAPEFITNRGCPIQSIVVSTRHVRPHAAFLHIKTVRLPTGRARFSRVHEPEPGGPDVGQWSEGQVGNLTTIMEHITKRCPYFMRCANHLQIY